ncbi:MAG: hypothetical protein IH840_00220 [Candidatus Heimdallarchaeota archaeon]|nr:hypothetical protein [Candidatus Heimdallarchaeota archaeon]
MVIILVFMQPANNTVSGQQGENLIDLHTIGDGQNHMELEINWRIERKSFFRISHQLMDLDAETWVFYTIGLYLEYGTYFQTAQTVRFGLDIITDAYILNSFVFGVANVGNDSVGTDGSAGYLPLGDTNAPDGNSIKFDLAITSTTDLSSVTHTDFLVNFTHREAADEGVRYGLPGGFAIVLKVAFTIPVIDNIRVEEYHHTIWIQPEFDTITSQSRLSTKLGIPYFSLILMMIIVKRKLLDRQIK